MKNNLTRIISVGQADACRCYWRYEYMYPRASKIFFAIALILAIYVLVIMTWGTLNPVLEGIFYEGKPILAYITMSNYSSGLWASVAGVMFFAASRFTANKNSVNEAGTFVLASCVFGIVLSKPSKRLIIGNEAELLLVAPILLFIAVFVAFWLKGKA